VTLAEELIAETRPDLLVVAWLGTALTQTKGLTGLVTGLKVITDLATTKWADLEPPVEKAKVRVGIFDWFFERQVLWLDNASALAKPDLEKAAFELARLECFLKNTYGPAAPLSSDLKSRLCAAQNATDSVPPIPNPDPALSLNPTKTKNGPSEPNLSGSFGPTLVPAPNQEREKTLVTDSPLNLSELKTTALTVAQELLANDVLDPASYVLRRFALWSLLRNPPPLTDNRLPLRSPSEHLLENLRALTRNSPKQALLYLENEASIHIYALDLSCLSIHALAALGPDGFRARESLSGALLGFVGAWPWLLTASFEDGAPVVSQSGRTLIASLFKAPKTLSSIPKNHLSNPGSPKKPSNQQNLVDQLNPVDQLIKNPEPPPHLVELSHAPLPTGLLKAYSAKISRGQGVRRELKIYLKLLALAPQGPYPALTLAVGPKVLAILKKHKLYAYEPKFYAKALDCLRRTALAHLEAGSEGSESFLALADQAQKELLPLNPFLALK
jgi:type VI secretion system ImpA/VasJ family protein